MIGFMIRYIPQKTSWGRHHKHATDLASALAETAVDIAMSPVILGGEPKKTKEFLKDEIQRIRKQYGISMREAKMVIRAAVARTAPYAKSLV